MVCHGCSLLLTLLCEALEMFIKFVSRFGTIITMHTPTKQVHTQTCRHTCTDTGHAHTHTHTHTQRQSSDSIFHISVLKPPLSSHITPLPSSRSKEHTSKLQSHLN